MKILVVDDTKENRELFRVVLNQCGYEVIDAKDGREGVAMAREHMPGLIFMDIQMPVMNGVTATRMLKGDPQTKNIKIISLSAFAENAAVSEFFSAGFDDYISKPINIRQLPEMIKRHLG